MAESIMFQWGIRGPWQAEPGERVEVGDGRGLLVPEGAPDWSGAKFEADLLNILGEKIGTAKCEVC